MNINLKTDYSYLFNNLPGRTGGFGGGSSFGVSNFLADYASIKNGSYGKLMKAYYAKPDTTDKVDSVPKKDMPDVTKAATKKELTQIQSDADALKESADALLTRGKDSVFTKKDVVSKDEAGNEVTTKEYDTNAIYKAVDSFVKDYNALVKSADSVGTNRISNGLDAMTGTTQTYEKLLSKAGITVNEDNTLSINEETFKKADMQSVQSMFQGTGSYAYNISAKASMMNFYAVSEANKMNTYNFNGNYSNNFATGNLYNGYM